MRTSSTRRLSALCGSVAALLAAVALSWPGTRHWIVEQWNLHRLENADPADRFEMVALPFESVASRRGFRRLIDLYAHVERLRGSPEYIAFTAGAFVPHAGERFLNRPPSDCIALFIEGMESQDAYIRLVCAPVLGRHRVAEALSVLLSGLSDADARVRQECARAIENMEVSSSVVAEQLAETLQDPDWQVRVSAASAIQNLHPSHQRRIVPSIVDTIRRDDDEFVVSISARKLGLLAADSAEVVKALRDRLESSSPTGFASVSLRWALSAVSGE